jgi:NAD-dependent deacetylase
MKAARSVGVITGAGISTSSGIPTYRGKLGLYEADDGMDIMEALSGETFRRDPDRTWKALIALARTSFHAGPNEAHYAIARLEQYVPDFALLTQNVDGLHQLAGSRGVIDIHGDLRITACTRCHGTGAFTVADVERGHPPSCASCGGAVRPAVVLFDERLDERKLVRLQAAFLRRVPDVVISVGTSSLFPYIAEPVRMAALVGHTTVEINPDRTDLSSLVEFHLQGPSEEILPDLMVAAFGPATDPSKTR